MEEGEGHGPSNSVLIQSTPWGHGTAESCEQVARDRGLILPGRHTYAIFGVRIGLGSAPIGLPGCLYCSPGGVTYGGGPQAPPDR